LDQELQISDFSYELPEELIAQEPSPRRDQARLLVVERSTRALRDSHVAALPEWLRPGDLLVFNNTRVLPARLFGTRTATGGKWEGLYLQQTAEETAEFMCHTRGYLRAGEWVHLRDRKGLPSSTRLQVVGRTPDKHLLLRAEDGAKILEVLQVFGHIPIPPYIRKGIDQEADRERYQTVFAQHPGSVAAPTAGLHFTPELLQHLSLRGIEQAFVTLHVGLGTFQPIKVERLAEHVMHREWCAVPAETVAAIAACRQRKGRVVAVGTTTVRTLESAVLQHDGNLQAWSGPTDLFIRPSFSFRVVDAVFTNFHLPRSTLLIMISAFAGRALARCAYEHALRQRYRFFSYGDAMLIL
jgi:S-adenosylmethionine:tRNA ribosyltransferase-isomerase